MFGMAIDSRVLELVRSPKPSVLVKTVAVGADNHKSAHKIAIYRRVEVKTSEYFIKRFGVTLALPLRVKDHKIFKAYAAINYSHTYIPVLLTYTHDSCVLLFVYSKTSKFPKGNKAQILMILLQYYFLKC